MRPANQQQAVRQMEHLLKHKLTGNRQTRVKEHSIRAKYIAVVIWKRFNVGPYQYQLKHFRWYLAIYSKDLKPATHYRHWLTVKNLLLALNVDCRWEEQLHGSGLTPKKITPPLAEIHISLVLSKGAPWVAQISVPL